MSQFANNLPNAIDLWLTPGFRLNKKGDNTMKIKAILQKPMVQFVALSHIIFWLWLTIIGFGMMRGASPSFLHVMQIIAAWSSTFAFVILSGKLVLEESIWIFVKKQFATKVKASIMAKALLLQLAIFFIGIIGLKEINEIQGISFSGFQLVLIAFFDLLIRGSLGEELGWRGYALNEFQKKHCPLKAALLVGLLWGTWHGSLWLLSEYRGIGLILYSISFMIGILGISIIITFFYNLNKNLLIPILIHQSFNFFLYLSQNMRINSIWYTLLAYGFAGLVLIVVNPMQVLYGKKDEQEYVSGYSKSE